MRRTGGVIAAYLIVLQAVLAGVALGAAPVAADPFTTLCRTLASDETPGPEKGHAALPDCCVGVCALHAVGVEGPSDSFAPASPDVAAEPAATKPDALGPPSQDRTPANPRAPPVRA